MNTENGRQKERSEGDSLKETAVERLGDRLRERMTHHETKILSQVERKRTAERERLTNGEGIRDKI